MRIPDFNGFVGFGVRNCAKNSLKSASDISKRFNVVIPIDDDDECHFIKPLLKDTVSFGSTAQYLKKYNTLPDEIKKNLSPKDAVVMFKDMERIAKGIDKGDKIGQGEDSAVYENPWLDGYYLLVLKEPTVRNPRVYSEISLGDSIWSDNNDSRIQLIKGA